MEQKQEYCRSNQEKMKGGMAVKVTSNRLNYLQAANRK
jgi:flagellar biosynthesis chaperone FliJ